MGRHPHNGRSPRSARCYRRTIPHIVTGKPLFPYQIRDSRMILRQTVSEETYHWLPNGIVRSVPRVLLVVVTAGMYGNNVVKRGAKSNKQFNTPSDGEKGC